MEINILQKYKVRLFISNTKTCSEVISLVAINNQIEIHAITQKTSIFKWISIGIAVYALITAVKLISSGFGLAATLFDYVSNPLVAFSVGILATVLTQSSTTTTSITVGLVATGLPMSTVVPILLGANIGTTITNTIVALSSPSVNGDREIFRRSFAAASIHDFFNIAAVAIFLPLEIFFNFLEKITHFMINIFSFDTTGNGLNIIVFITDVFSFIMGVLSNILFSMLSQLSSVMGDIITGIFIIGLAITLLIFSIRYISQQLSSLLVGKAEKSLKFAISHNPFYGVLSGFLITSAVQSSSTTTSLAVPLVGSNCFTLKQIYPFYGRGKYWNYFDSIACCYYTIRK